MAVLGQDRLGVELHALDVEVLVAHAHDFAVVGPGGDFEAGRQGRALDRQRMVANHRKWTWQALEYAFSGVRDHRGLAVHDLFGAHDLAAECFADRLVTEADAEDRQLALEVLDDLDRDARVAWRFRAWRNADAVEFHGRDLGDRDLVVAHRAHFFTELAEILDDVIGEGIVVVDHE